MAYNSNYTGAEVDALLDKIKDDDVGDIDSSLSTTSENPVMNKVITTELNKKATKTEVSSLSTTVTENKTATDTALSDLSAKVDEEVEGLQTQLDSNGVLIEDLQESKADIRGYYPELHVGLSDNLPDRGDIVEGAIGFRASAGDGNSIEDGVANVKELLGDSVVWNQLGVDEATSFDFDNTTNTNVSYKYIASIPNYTSAIEGHKIIAQAYGDYSGVNYFYFNDSNQGSINSPLIFIAKSATTKVALYAAISAGQRGVGSVKVRFIDLTLMFGAGNEPSTVEEFNAFCNQLVGVDLNAYNEGEVLGVHAKGFKSVNDNAWDEEWELGTLSTTTGLPTTSASSIRAKDFIKVLPSSDYYVTAPTEIQDNIRLYFYDAGKNFIERWFKINEVFTIPSNAHYMKLIVNSTTTYNHDICIRLAHSGYKTDYVAHEESKSSFDLTPYFPYGMHGIGEVRDSATPSKATRRIGVVDLGTLSWNLSSTYSSLFFARIADVKPTTTNNFVGNILTSKYVTLEREGIHNYDKSCALDNVYHVFVKDSAYTDAASFKEAMSGVYLYYELAEPIETEIDPMQNFSYEVWDFGTEEMISDVPSMPVTTRTIYGFNATDTIRGNKAKNEEQDARLDTLEEDVVRVGDYQPNLSVGLADQLAGHEDATPSEIGFRRSGGGAILDGNARIESIKGNSVVWNQMVKTPTGSKEANGVHYISQGDGSIKVYTDDAGAIEETNYSSAAIYLIPTHKYAMLGGAQGSGSTSYYLYWTAFGKSDLGGGLIETYSGSGAASYWVFVTKAGVVIPQSSPLIFCPRIIDLTLMFGAGNEPTTIEEFYARKPIVADENAYNEGEVIHMEADAIKSVGVNQWDEQWENGTYNPSNGVPATNNNAIRCKNPIKVLPNTKYYGFNGDLANTDALMWGLFFDADDNLIKDVRGAGVNYVSLNNATCTTPTNAFYLRFYVISCATYNHDICINLSDTEVNGQYFPYVKREQTLEVIKKYFPNGMRSAGTAHDEIRYNSTTQKWEAIKRIGEIDFSGAKAYTTVENTFFLPIADMKAPTNNAERGTGLLCAKYPMHGGTDGYSVAVMDDKSMLRMSNGNIYIKDSTYGADVDAFKAAMSGVILYYELAEPIVTEIDENINLDYEVWNVGTEKAIAEAPSTPLKADIIYGFNAYGVIKELLARVASLEAANASLASQLASVTSHNEEV